MAKKAAWVKTYGLAGVPPDASLLPVASLAEAIDGAGVVVFPISGVNAGGIVKVNTGVEIKIGPEFFARLPVSAVVATGSLPRPLQEAAATHGIKVLEYAERDEIAIPNAIPTAEGAIQLWSIPFHLDGSTCQDCYGRWALTKRLVALAGLPWRLLGKLRRQRPPVLQEEPSCWERSESGDRLNTIPFRSAGILEQAPSRLLIIDLASAPWGTDFDAAARRGIKAFPAPGLPGKVAPETAGKILATHLPGLIEEACVRPD